MFHYKHGSLAPSKDNKGATVVNSFKSILNDLKRRPKKIWFIKAANFITDLLNRDWLIIA